MNTTRLASLWKGFVVGGFLLTALVLTPLRADAGQRIGPRFYPKLKFVPTLEGSLDWGDLGPDWRKELSIFGTEELLFRWTIAAPSAAKGRWEISTLGEVLLAQGEVGAPPTPGSYYQFSLNVAALGLSPPLKVRIQALTSTGSDVGQISSPVIVNQAVNTGWGMCFTDGGLGLPITDKLEAIRAAHGVPALGGAVVTKHGLEVFDAVGIRKVEADPANEVPVTKFDAWHLGSDAKAMTSMLVGILHEEFPSTIGFDTTIADAFAEWAGTMDPTLAQTTLRDLLAHRSGLYYLTQEQADKLSAPNLSVTQQRREFTHAVVHDPQLLLPGVLFKYENGNYVIAGAMLENLFQQSWEDLITQYLFQPLGMSSAGFGSPAQGGQPQPWGHYDDDGAYAPTLGDNPPSLGPAGTVHASLADWAKFIRLYLKGQEGGVSITGATLDELTTPYTSSDPWFAVWPNLYAWGWGMFGTNVDRGIGHDGSNGLWYVSAVVYMDRGYALLAVTNAASIGEINHGQEAVAAVMTMLEAHHSDCPDNRGRFRFFSAPGGSGEFSGPLPVREP